LERICKQMMVENKIEQLENDRKSENVFLGLCGTPEINQACDFL